MRNLFDQYSQNENKLTHALVTALYEDRKLLRSFLLWSIGQRSLPKNLEIVEQQLVGEPVESEEEAERRGLPDAIIHDNEDWRVLIESKVAARLTKNQLERHYNTAWSRDFSDITVLAITVAEIKRDLPQYVQQITWIECFKWLKKHEEQSEWSGRVADYMQILEAKWVSDGYLQEGAMTVFTGIPFSEERPYNYREAKLYLKQVMEELRKRRDLSKVLGADLNSPGRGAITGKKATSVWDLIPLKAAAQSNAHTSFPHLTFSLAQDYVQVIAILPSSMKSAMWSRLQSLSEAEFTNMLSEIHRNMAPILKKVPSAVPTVGTLQRHYPSRSSKPVKDAELVFDLRAVVPTRNKSPIKFQPEWISASYLALTNKRSNMTFSIGIRFPYENGRYTNNTKIIDHICDTWIACKPLFSSVL